MKRIGKFIATLTLFAMGVLSFTGANVLALPGGAGGTGGTTTSSGGGNSGGEEACAALTEVGVTCDATAEPEKLASKTLKSLINLFSIIVGGVCVMMVILGGFKFVTSGGDSDGIKSARNTIIYAAVGLVIVLLAQSIVYFVFAKANDFQPTPTTPTTTKVI